MRVQIVALLTNHTTDGYLALAAVNALPQPKDHSGVGAWSRRAWPRSQFLFRLGKGSLLILAVNVLSINVSYVVSKRVLPTLYV